MSTAILLFIYSSQNSFEVLHVRERYINVLTNIKHVLKGDSEVEP